MTKRKEQRRELLKEDEFLSYMERGIRYAQSHRSQTVGLVVAFFAVIGIGIGIFEWNKSKHENAAQMLFEVEQLMLQAYDDPDADQKFESEQAKNEAVLGKLDAIIGGQTGISADQAQIHKVAILLNLGRESDALDTYKGLANRSGEMGLFALIGLGDFYLGANQPDEALNFYNQVLARPDGKAAYEDLIKYKMAQCYKEKGDENTAREELESIVGKYESVDDKAPIFQQAKTMLDEINQKTAASSGGAS